MEEQICPKPFMSKNSPSTFYNQEIDTNNLMVCVNECCEVYCRSSCVKFQESFKHCPYCAGKLITESYAMLLLERKRL